MRQFTGIVVEGGIHGGGGGGGVGNTGGTKINWNEKTIACVCK